MAVAMEDMIKLTVVTALVTVVVKPTVPHMVVTAVEMDTTAEDTTAVPILEGTQVTVRLPHPAQVVRRREGIHRHLRLRRTY